MLNATYPYPGAEQFHFEGMTSFALEQHLACDCLCTVRPEHCHPTKHTYLADSCRCECRDTSGSTACPLRKKWSERECACVCENQYSCYDDEFFDSATCRLYIDHVGLIRIDSPSFPLNSIQFKIVYFQHNT